MARPGSRSAPPIPEAVLLDAGNTLVFVDRRRMIRIFRDEGGVEVDEGSFREAEYEARLALARTVEEGSSGTEDHVWREYFLTLFRKAGIPSDRVEAVGTRIKVVHEERHLWSHVEEGTAAALSRLRGLGCRLAVVSNADGRVERLLEDAGLTPHLEFVIDSQVLGVEKPDPGIFEEACRRLGLPPSRCLYVGDLYPVDVVGARRAGLQALLLDPLGRLDYPVETIRSVAELPAYLEEVRSRVGP